MVPKYQNADVELHVLITENSRVIKIDPKTFSSSNFSGVLYMSAYYT